MATDYVTNLRELAEDLDEYGYFFPPGSADLCRRVAKEIERLRSIIDADDKYIAAWDRFAFVCVPRGCGKTQLAAARERCVKARQAAEAGGEG